MTDLIIEFLNSGLGMTVIASLAVLALNYLYTKKPGWQKYEGAIISGIKYAEKKIPDGSTNKSLRRFDAAMRYVVKVYEQTHGKKPSSNKYHELAEGIRGIHYRMEQDGTLKK